VPVPDFDINDRHGSAWKGASYSRRRRSGLCSAAAQDYTGCSDELSILRKWRSCLRFKQGPVLAGWWRISLVGSPSIASASFELACFCLVDSILRFQPLSKRLVSQDTSWTSSSLFVALAACSTGLNLVIPRSRGIAGKVSSHIHAKLAH
jgi:hypothetical protein